MKYEYFSALVFSPLMSILPRNRFCLVTQRSFFLIVEERCVTRQKRLQWRLFYNKWIRGNLRSHSATSAEPRKFLGNFKDRHIQWVWLCTTDKPPKNYLYLVIMSPGQKKQPALAGDENGYFHFRRWRPGHNIDTVISSFTWPRTR